MATFTDIKTSFSFPSQISFSLLLFFLEGGLGIETSPNLCLWASTCLSSTDSQLHVPTPEHYTIFHFIYPYSWHYYLIMKKLLDSANIICSFSIFISSILSRKDIIPNHRDIYAKGLKPWRSF